jgi:hypothetical protein
LAALHLRSAATSVLPVALPEPTAPAPSRPPLAYTDGVFSDDTGRWTVGAPGDEVAVGDWDCDGTPTLTLLRISTGTVYAFLTWATADADATADALGVIDSANRLESADFDGDGCDDLLVHRRAGAPITMHPPDHL